MKNQIIKLFCVLALLSFTPFFSQTLLAQSPDTMIESDGDIKRNRWRGREMLKQIKNELEDRYYDPKYRGIDIDARFEKAKNDIEKAELNGQIFAIIAQVLLEFNDSHTRFYPPGRAYRPLYGFVTQMIGNTCHIIRVDKDSDAEKKGLKAGDIITSIGGYVPTRDTLSTIKYILYSLNPQPKLALKIKSGDSEEKIVQIETKFKSIAKRRKEDFKRGSVEREAIKCEKIDSKIAACKLYSFSVDKSDIDKMMGFVEDHENFILDLRGNGGGYVHIEEYLVGHFFDKKIKVGDFITRKKSEERIVKPQDDNAFKGNLIVLIDSNSGSASEVFARVMQLEKRGKIIGDVSAGAVMTSNFLRMATRYGTPGNEIISLYGLNLTVGDLNMSDGDRLENIGVTPDVLVGPNQIALSEGKDPVLAYSVELLGGKISDIEAGKIGFLKVRSEEGLFDEDN